METKKIARREIRGVRGMWKHSNVVFKWEILRHLELCVVSQCRATESTCPQVRTTTSKCLAHAPEHGDVNFLVDRLPLRDKFVMNNTPGVEKDYHTLCCLWMPLFFDGGVPVDCHSALSLLVWGSYWKHHDSSSAMILLTNVIVLRLV